MKYLGGWLGRGFGSRQEPARSSERVEDRYGVTSGMHVDRGALGRACGRPLERESQGEAGGARVDCG